MISVILRTFINQSQNQNLESMNLILVDDCFISLILRWHLDMIVVEVDEFELVRHYCKECGPGVTECLTLKLTFDVSQLCS